MKNFLKNNQKILRLSPTKLFCVSGCRFGGSGSMLGGYESDHAPLPIGSNSKSSKNQFPDNTPPIYSKEVDS